MDHTALIAKARARLRKLQISDVSSVDRGANPHARVVFTKADRVTASKRAEEAKPMTSMIETLLSMPEPVLKLAIQADGIPSAVHAHALITEIAKRRQWPGETKEQSYSRVVTDGGLGSMLFHKHQELTRGWAVPGQEEALHKLVEHPIGKAKNTLPQDRPGEMQTHFNDGPTATSNRPSAADSYVTAEDDAKLLEAVKNGDVSAFDPRVSIAHRREKEARMKKLGEMGGI